MRSISAITKRRREVAQKESQEEGIRKNAQDGEEKMTTDIFYQRISEALDKCDIPDNRIIVESCAWCQASNEPHSKACPLGERQQCIVANGGPFCVSLMSLKKDCGSVYSKNETEKMFEKFRQPEPQYGEFPF